MLSGAFRTLHFTFHMQGGKASSDEPCPTKLSRWRGSNERRLGVYLLSFSQAVTLLLHGLIHGSSCFHPQTLVLQLSCAARSPPLSPADMRNNLCSNVYNFLDLSPCRSIAFLLIVGIELTANQCQSVHGRRAVWERPGSQCNKTKIPHTNVGNKY